MLESAWIPLDSLSVRVAGEETRMDGLIRISPFRVISADILLSLVTGPRLSTRLSAAFQQLLAS